MNLRLTYIGLISLSVVGYVWMGYFIERADFVQVLWCFVCLFLCYFLLLRTRFQWHWKQLFWVAMALRLTQLLVVPPLSDDFHRFLWDGKMTLSGENPYVIVPNQFAKTTEDRELIHLAEAMNSPQYYTIYPPVSQGFFALAVWLANGHVDLATYMLRLMLLLMEAMLLWYLPRILRAFNQKPQQMAWYALNPLVIVEISGNLHFEAAVLTFMALSLWAFLQRKIMWSALFAALAISTKLLPVLLLPMLWKPLSKYRWLFYILTLLFTILTFFPFMSSDLIAHWSQSIELFFKSFEFNASCYYLLREAGYFMFGYNIIHVLGPILSAVTILIILWISWFKPGKNADKPVWIYATYLFLATTVHPWYVVTLSGLGLISSYRWMYLWSALSILSYAHYKGGGFEENYILIALEYSLIFIFIFIEKKPLIQKNLNQWFNGYP